MKDKIKNKRLIATFVAAILLFGTVYAQPAFAYEDNNISFKFTVAAFYGNGQ